MSSVFLEKIKDITTKAAETRNFVIPGSKVTQYIPSPAAILQAQAQKQEEILPQRDNHTGLYIGKMLRNQDTSNNDMTTIYNDETIMGMLSFAYKANPQGVIHLYIGPMLYDVLADDEIKTDTLSVDEQKKKLFFLAQKCGIPKEHIAIYTLDESHKELFNDLRAGGVDGLPKQTYITSITKKTTSAELAGFFYTLCDKYPEVETTFFSLVPFQLQKALSDKNNLQYYGLIECAIRIIDLYNGITTQGGLVRQKKYDDVMLRLMSGETGISPIDTLFTPTRDISAQQFSRRYFKNDTYKKLLPKEEKKQTLKAKARNMSMGIGMAILAARGGYKYSSYHTAKTAEAQATAQREFLLQKAVEDKNVTRYFESFVDSPDTPEGKAAIIKSFITSKSNDFVHIYGLGMLSKRELESMMISSFIEPEYITIRIGKSPSDRESDFIHDIFIPQHRLYLQSKGISLIPYDLSPDLKSLEQQGVFLNTLQASEDVAMYLKDEGNIILSPKNGSSSIRYGSSGKYKDDAREVVFIDDVPYISWSCASEYRDEDTGEKVYKPSGKTYSIGIAQGILQKMYEARYPILKEIEKMYRIRYMDKQDAVNPYTYGYTIIPYIVTACVQSGGLDELSRCDDDTKIRTIAMYLEKDIIPKHHKKLQEWGGTNIPYAFLRPYETACKNTIAYTGSNLLDGERNMAAIQSSLYLGRFQDDEGKMYAVHCITIKGKEYILAKEQSDSSIRGISNGQHVATKLLDLRKK